VLERDADEHDEQDQDDGRPQNQETESAQTVLEFGLRRAGRQTHGDVAEERVRPRRRRRRHRSTAHVDRTYISRPQRWDMSLIRDFMVFVGPVSSLFDFLTFYVLLHVLHATEPLFHTGWFVESLATQTLVLFVIRTMGNPFASRPSAALTWTTLAVVVAGVALPATPLAPLLGFTRPPLRYFAFLVAAVITYLALVEVVKRRVVQRLKI